MEKRRLRATEFADKLYKMIVAFSRGHGYPKARIQCRAKGLIIVVFKDYDNIFMHSIGQINYKLAVKGIENMQTDAWLKEKLKGTQIAG